VFLAVACLIGTLDATAESDALPKAPDIVLKQASATRLLFTWDQEANVPAYDVYLGTTHIGMTTFTKADFRNLACAKQYVVHVAAVDRRGARSVAAVKYGTTASCTPSTPTRKPEPPRPPGGGSGGGGGGPTPSPPPPPGPPPTGPPPPPGSTLGVAPGGSDKNPCTVAQPCATFDRAYHAASPGQGVYVAAGSYPKQVITADPTKANAGADVVFLPAAGANVHVNGVSIYGSHVELRSLQTAWHVQSGAKGVTLRNVIADSAISINGASNVSVLGGQVYSPVRVSSDPVIASSRGLVPTNILIDGVYFHDFVDVGPGQLHHIECLQVGGAINLTIQNSTFRNCGTHDIFIRSWGHINASPYPLQNIVVQNNSFAATVAGYYVMQIMDDLWTSSPTSFVVQNNTAAQTILIRVTHGVAQVRNNAVPSSGGGGGSSSSSSHLTPVPAGTLRTRGGG
jgi:hypothetical protein